MPFLRSILNARFLRYVTLVVVACCGFLVHFSIDRSLGYANNIFMMSRSIELGFPLTMANACTEDAGSQECFNELVADRADRATSGVDTTLINVLNTVIALISLIYVPFSMLSSWLLSPDWTFGDFIHLRGTLHSLWIFVSNTVYVVFAAMLIVVAIANIFGQSDSYAIKKMLPRFIIGVIMVPFTWWIVSATLSVSSYMTALVLRMPADIIVTESKDFNVNIPSKCTLDFTNNTESKKIWDCEDKVTPKKLSEYLLEGNGAYGIIPLYAYNIFKFNQLDEFKTVLNSDDTRVAGYESMTPEDKAKFDAADKDTKSAMLQAAIIATGLGKIGIQLLMSAIFAIVFTIVLIALVIVLFTRVIRMWMYAIFSPLFALRYFLSDKIDKDNALSKFDFKEFIGLAMVPVVVSAALGFGFMFIMTFKTHMEQPAKGNQKGIDSPFVQVDKDGTGTGGNIQFFGTTINIRLSDTNGAGVGADGNSVKADDLKAALFNVLSGLITPIFGVVILWMAVMAAMKTSKIAGAAVEGIEKLGGEAAGMAKKLPGMIPTGMTHTNPTTGKKENINFKQLGMTPDIFKGWMQEKEGKERQAMQAWMGIGDNLKDVAAAIKNATVEKGAGIWSNSMDGKELNARYKVANQQKNLLAMAEKVGVTVTPEQTAKLSAATESGTFRDIEKQILEKLRGNPSFTLEQRGKLNTLYSSWRGTKDDVDELNEILGGTSGDAENDTKKVIKASEVNMPGDFATNRKISLSDGVNGTYTLDLSSFNKNSSDADIQAFITSNLPSDRFKIDGTELAAFVQKIKAALPPAGTP